MKKALWVLSSLALAGFAFTACDEDGGSDGCNNSCDYDKAICAPMINGDKSYECVDISILASDHECYDSASKAIKDGWALEKDAQYGDYACKQNTQTHTVACADGDSSKCPADLPVCDSVQKVCVEASAAKDYKYVRIDDMSGDKAKGSDPGADIDAVVLVKKSDGSNAVSYATKHVAFERGDKASTADGKIYAADPAKIVGAPDSLINYGKSADADVCYYYRKDSTCAGKDACNSDKSTYCGKTGVTCNTTDPTAADYYDFDYSFVSLAGGYIVVEMAEAISAGDQLDIIEIGNCKLTNTGSHAAGSGFATNSASAEKMKVSVSISNAEGSFREIGQGTAGTNNMPKGVYSISISDNMLKGAN